MNKTPVAAAITGLLAPTGAALAIDYHVSGHVNRMLRLADDGVTSDIQHLDNSASRTRFRFTGSGNVGAGIRATIFVETSVASNVSFVTPLKAADGFDVAFDIRHSALSFGGKLGKLTLGHTDSSANDLYFADFSDTFMVDEYTSEELAGGIAFRTPDGGTVTAAPGSGLCGASATQAGVCRVLDSRDSIDGGRYDLLRYDSPTIGPVSFAADIGDDGAYSVAAFFQKKWNGAQILVQGGFGEESTSVGSDYQAVGVGVVLAQGTNLNAFIASRRFPVPGRVDQFDWYVKLGQRIGNHRVSASLGVSEDALANGADGEMWGFGYAYVSSRPQIELYVGYKHYELATNATARRALGLGTDAEDVNVLVTGTRIKFE